MKGLEVPVGLVQVRVRVVIIIDLEPTQGKRTQGTIREH